MSAETDRLEREAEDRRRRLDSTLSQLENRFSASSLVDEVADYMRDGQGAAALRRLGRQVRDNPVALGIIGAGVAWLLLGRAGGSKSRHRRRQDRDFDRRDYDYQTTGNFDLRHEERDRADRRRYSSGNGNGDYGQYSNDDKRNAGDDGESSHSILHDAKDRLYQASHKVSDKAHSAGDWARDQLHETREAGRRAAEAVRRGTSYLSHEGRRLIDDGRGRMQHVIEEQPLIVGAVAVAIGAAIGAALPSTRKEDELLGKTRDRLREKASELGDEMVDRAKHVAETAMHAADEKAGEVGLKPEGGETIAEKVSSVAEAAVDAAKDDAKKQGLL